MQQTTAGLIMALMEKLQVKSGQMMAGREIKWSKRKKITHENILKAVFIKPELYALYILEALCNIYRSLEA